MEIDLGGVVLSGVSVGGFASSLDVPEWKVVVDVGVCLEHAVPRDHVLITHAHADHLGALAQHVAQRGLRRLHPAMYLVPPGIEDDIDRLLEAWRALDGGAMAANVRPLAPGSRFGVRADLVVRPFRTEHRVPSQGWIFERVCRRLRSDLRGLAPSEIAARRRAGQDVDEVEHSVELAITGDTTFDGIATNEEVLGAKRLVLECTFLDDSVSSERARDMGHVHLDEIAAAAHEGRFGCEALLLNHVSPRYRAPHAAELIERKLPAELLERTQWMVSR